MDTKQIAQGMASVLNADDIAALPEVPLSSSIEGVTHRVLWQTGESMAGVMTVAAGHHLGGHVHRRNEHHLWILEGEIDVVGSRAAAGGYVHVPAGLEHDLDATATSGCTLFYLYLRQPG
jgi:mannose-6-phosphate isomerase-like protein (cupin superfamily)